MSSKSGARRTRRRPRVGARRRGRNVARWRERRLRRVIRHSQPDGRRPARLSGSRRRRARRGEVPRTGDSLASGTATDGGGIVTRARVIRIATAFAAAGFVALSAVLPLWSMTMRAPQYPKGLRLYAYGTGMSGDLRELNILNHYIGMPPIAAPAAETAMFPIGIALLVGLCVIAPLHRWLRRIAVVAIAAVPLGILVDLQWRLYEFGHTLNPTAPIRLKPFTPLVLGSTKMGNFTSTSIISTGLVCFVAAALCLWLGARFGKRHEHPMRVPATARRAAAAAVIGAIAIVPA